MKILAMENLTNGPVSLNYYFVLRDDYVFGFVIRWTNGSQNGHEFVLPLDATNGEIAASPELIAIIKAGGKTPFSARQYLTRKTRQGGMKIHNLFDALDDEGQVKLVLLNEWVAQFLKLERMAVK